MKKFSVSLSLVAVALCAGCATEGVGPIGVDTATGEPRVLYCKDGAYVTKSMGCGAGVERVLTPPSPPVLTPPPAVLILPPPPVLVR